MINKCLPIIDQLYIFQTQEYEPINFLNWFIKNPFKRNLQKKHQLSLTTKATLLLAVSLVLILLSAGAIVWWGLNLPPGHWYSDITTIILFLILVQFFSPIYLVLAWIIVYPIEEYQKYQIISAARKKLQTLPNLKVIAITGSFAKTSTKDILYTLLWKNFKVVKTPKSYNTEISIARTILSDLKDNTEIFLVEMDAYHPGEIKNLAEFVKPKMGIITSIAPQHLERFGSMEKLAKTQFELAESLPKDGLLILNSSSGWILNLEDQYKVAKIFYGDRKEDNFYARNIKQTGEGVMFKLHVSCRSEPFDFAQDDIFLPLFGTHHISNFLAAAAAAQGLGLPLNKISERARWILPTPHRLEVKIQGSLTIIDNTYNTNPIASRSSLKLLKDLKGAQKVLITPGLVELGREHSKENQEFAKAAAEVADQIIIVAEFAKKDLLKGLEKVQFSKEKIHLVKTTQDGIGLLSKIVKGECVVLLENDLPDQYF